MFRSFPAIVVAGLLLAPQAVSDETSDARVDEFVVSLVEGDELERLSAAHQLGRIGLAARGAEPQLLQALSDSDEFVRSTAADSLLRLGADTRLVLPLLEDTKVRLSVVESLLSLRKEAAPVAPALVEITRNGSDGNERTLLNALNAELSSQLQMALFESLDDVDETRADAACRCIEELGRLELSSVPALIELLNSPRRMARLSGAKLLMRMGPVAHRAGPALRALSKDSDAELSLTAYTALATVAGDEDAVGSVAAAVTNDDPKMRSLALTLLEELGPNAARAARALVVAITEENRQLPDDFRRRCAGDLAELGPGVMSELVPGIERCREEALLELAVWPIRVFGPTAARAADALAGRLRDVDRESTRVEIMDALGCIGPEARAAIPAVLEQLESEAPRARATAAETLGKIGGEIDGLRPRFAPLLNDDSADVRLQSGVALLLLGADSHGVMPTLLEFIKDDDPELCIRALSGLRAAGPAAKAAVPKLIEALGYEGAVSAGFGSTPIALMAGTCLAAIGPAAVPHLAGALEHDDARVRARAAEALGSIGPEAKSAVNALVKVLDDQGMVTFHCGCMGWEQTVGQAAMRALGQIGPGAEAAVPELVQRLERELPLDESTFFGNASYLVEALRGIGKPARAAVPLLTKSLRPTGAEPDAAPLPLVVAALVRIAPDSPVVISEARHYLHHVRNNGSAASPAGSEFGEILDAIVALGEPGKSLLPELIDLCSTCPVLNVSMRCQAAGAALRLDRHCQPALRCLQSLSRHRDTFVRQEAEDELRRCREKSG